MKFSLANPKLSDLVFHLIFRLYPLLPTNDGTFAPSPNDPEFESQLLKEPAAGAPFNSAS